MRRYQKFLTTNPTFLGLGIADLFLIGLGLNLGLFFGWDSNASLAVIVLMVALGKCITKYVDVTGLILGFKRNQRISRTDLEETRNED